jgi:hypothetical protein
LLRVTRYALRVQFFDPHLETRNSQQPPITYFIKSTGAIILPWKKHPDPWSIYIVNRLRAGQVFQPDHRAPVLEQSPGKYGFYPAK